jgi:hypothetical protein
MPILQYHIDELKEIYLRQTGDNLSDKEAWDMAIRLVSLFGLLLEDDHKPFNRNDPGQPDDTSI